MPEDGSALRPNSPLVRLWKNQGRYLGETIEIGSVLDEIQAVAEKRGWQQDCFLRDVQDNGVCLTAYHLPARTPTNRKFLYISTGIHGDEPAGPLAALELIREHSTWPESLDVWICPCLNPTGFRRNSRESAAGIDLNRQYHQPDPPETRAHTLLLQQLPSFDVALSLHEDWEAHGFYLYELNPDQKPSFAEAIIRRVAKVCAIDPSSVIEGREAHHGIIRPTADLASRPQWPEAFYLIMHKTRRSYTFESPSDYRLGTRVAALVAGVEAVIEELVREN